MTNLTRDPKGYYIALGIAEDADADAIKAAYRARAKRLHPDFNPSPVAAKQFHRLHEAYATLSDPAARAAYDRPWRTAARKPEKQDRTKPQTRTEPPRTDRDRAAPPPPRSKPGAKPAADNGDGAAADPAVCQCGRITAQPRYVVFDQVWGRLRKVQKRAVAGVFCRSCADRAAVKASLITWIAGWWAWPDGPRETVKALANNIRGGRKPAERNARLLMRQARAFRARGETDLARGAAEQAIGFASPGLRGEIEAFLAPLGGSSRAIKDRWAKPGWAPMAQVLPLAILAAGLSTVVTMSTPVPLSTAITHFYARLTAPAPSAPLAPGTRGRVYTITKDGAALRTGPGAHYRLEAVLKAGALVLATEAAPNGRWLRVATADGTAGFMAAGDLSADVRLEALEHMDGFAAPVPPVDPPAAPPLASSPGAPDGAD